MIRGHQNKKQETPVWLSAALWKAILFLSLSVETVDVAAILDLLDESRVHIIFGLRIAVFRRCNLIQCGLNSLWLRNGKFTQAARDSFVDALRDLGFFDALISQCG